MMIDKKGTNSVPEDKIQQAQGLTDKKNNINKLGSYAKSMNPVFINKPPQHSNSTLKTSIGQTSFRDEKPPQPQKRLQGPSTIFLNKQN